VWAKRLGVGIGFGCIFVIHGDILEDLDHGEGEIKGNEQKAPIEQREMHRVLYQNEP
jgi:hypothetical protein